MTVDEAVDKAAREAAAVLAERGRRNFYGAVEVMYVEGQVVGLDIKESLRKPKQQ